MPESNIFFVSVFYLTAYLNFVVAVFNMIPAFPLDGGRVLVSLFWVVTKNFVLSMKIGAVIGFSIALFGIYYGWVHNAYILLFISVFVLIINLNILKSTHSEILKMKEATTV